MDLGVVGLFEVLLDSLRSPESTKTVLCSARGFLARRDLNDKEGRCDYMTLYGDD